MHHTSLPAPSQHSHDLPSIALTRAKTLLPCELGRLSRPPDASPLSVLTSSRPGREGLLPSSEATLLGEIGRLSGEVDRLSGRAGEERRFSSRLALTGDVDRDVIGEESRFPSRLVFSGELGRDFTGEGGRLEDR